MYSDLHSVLKLAQFPRAPHRFLSLLFCGRELGRLGVLFTQRVTNFIDAVGLTAPEKRYHQSMNIRMGTLKNQMCHPVTYGTGSLSHYAFMYTFPTHGRQGTSKNDSLR